MAVLLLCALHVTATASPTPFIEQRFNEDKGELLLFAGAEIGGPGSGVSGQPEDLAYSATADATETDIPGPAALVLGGEQEIQSDQATLTFWYRPGGAQSIVSSPLALAGFYIIFSKPGRFIVRLTTHAEEPMISWFAAPANPPVLPWTFEGDWIFVAFTWEGTENKATLYQGSPTIPVTIAEDYLPRSSGGPLRMRMPSGSAHVIGNNQATLKGETGTRPFNGRIDNVRVFTEALSEVQLEAIRQADAENRPLN